MEQAMAFFFSLRTVTIPIPQPMRAKCIYWCLQCEQHSVCRTLQAVLTPVALYNGFLGNAVIFLASLSFCLGRSVLSLVFSVGSSPSGVHFESFL